MQSIRKDRQRVARSRVIEEKTRLEAAKSLSGLTSGSTRRSCSLTAGLRQRAAEFRGAFERRTADCLVCSRAAQGSR